MKNNKLILSLSVFLVVPLFYSCGKTEFKRRLIIKITDSVYHKPIRGCHIHVKQDNGAEMLLFQESQFWDGITDNNGIAICEIKPFENIIASSLDITAGLQCFSNGGGGSYYSSYQFIDQKDLKIGKNYINFIFPPPGYININIKNTKPFNEADYFRMLWIGECNSGDRLFGKDVDTVFRFVVLSDRINNFSWSVIKNDIRTDFEDSIYCKAFDTTFFTINY